MLGMRALSDILHDESRVFEWLMVLSDFTVYYIVFLLLVPKDALNSHKSFTEELRLAKIIFITSIRIVLNYVIEFIYLLYLITFSYLFDTPKT